MSGLVTEIWRALWVMTLPVAAFSCALILWSMKRGHLRGEGGVRGLGREMKVLAAARKAHKKQRKLQKKGKAVAAPAAEPAVPEKKRDLVYDKWMKFGGGFYGVVAFYTYGVIEWREIVDFVAGFGGFWAMLEHISVGAAVEMLVNSILNFVAAIVWPLYWLKELPGRQPWLLFLAAYAGYWLGAWLAQRAAARPWPFDRLSSNAGSDE